MNPIHQTVIYSRKFG